MQVDLVGHSAGGWLARAYLADEKYHGTQLPARAVRTLVTLGAPHLAPPKGVPGVFDATRGALDWLNGTYPGAHFASVKVRCRDLPQQRVVPLSRTLSLRSFPFHLRVWHSDSMRRRRQPNPQYVTVAGKAVRGVEESAAERKQRKKQKGNRTPPQYAFGSYQQVGRLSPSEGNGCALFGGVPVLAQSG